MKIEPGQQWIIDGNIATVESVTENCITVAADTPTGATSKFWPFWMPHAFVKHFEPRAEPESGFALMDPMHTLFEDELKATHVSKEVNKELV